MYIVLNKESKINCYQAFYSRKYDVVFNILTDEKTERGFISEIIYLIIKDKLWDLLENFEIYDKTYFNINECDFSSYDVIDVKKFISITHLSPPIYVFYFLMTDLLEKGESTDELVQLFEEDYVFLYYQNLISQPKESYNLIIKLINNSNFISIKEEDYCILICVSFEETNYFLYKAIEDYGVKFKNYMLDFLIKNTSCDYKLYQFLFFMGAINTIKPNVKEYRFITGNKNLLRMIESF